MCISAHVFITVTMSMFILVNICKCVSLKVPSNIASDESLLLFPSAFTQYPSLLLLDYSPSLASFLHVASRVMSEG